MWGKCFKTNFKNTDVKVRIFRIFNTFGLNENWNNLKNNGKYLFKLSLEKKPLIIKGSLKDTEI